MMQSKKKKCLPRTTVQELDRSPIRDIKTFMSIMREINPEADEKNQLYNRAMEEHGDRLADLYTVNNRNPIPSLNKIL
jgi:hypothetical protein